MRLLRMVEPLALYRTCEKRIMTALTSLQAGVRNRQWAVYPVRSTRVRVVQFLSACAVRLVSLFLTSPHRTARALLPWPLGRRGTLP